jgi:glycosyltransferase involved in cell wall biosynthesis
LPGVSHENKIMKLSIIIPCYNEKVTIAELLHRVKASPVEEKEIILVDDGSTDGTTELITTQLVGLVDKVVYHDCNLGKGAAITSGLREVSGDLVIIQDADLEYDPNEYPLLMAPLLAGNADVVYGSRFSGGGPHRVHMFWHYVGNKFLTILSNMFTNLNLTDMETCFKLCRADIIRDITIQQKGFGVEPELTAKLARKKCRIYEIGISYYGRSYAEGKKISWKDGLKALYVIVKYGIFK